MGTKRGREAGWREAAGVMPARQSGEIGVAIPAIEQINGHRCHLASENRDLSRYFTGCLIV